MIRRVVISGFKQFRHLEFEMHGRTVIAGLNNSGKTTLLQALITWSELGEIWLNNADLARKADGTFHQIELDVASFKTLALFRFDQLWRNQDTREPISIRVATDSWDVGFDLYYQDSTVAKVGPLAEISEDQLENYAKRPLKALFIPSLSGMDLHEPEYAERVLITRLAHGKGGTVIRNLIQMTSREDPKWKRLQNTVDTFFGFELSKPSGVDPIVVRYRHSPVEHWYDLANGAAGLLQTILIQSALLYSDASLFLLDEPDVHLHALLKEKMYHLIREHCDENGCQAVIATHSSRLIEEAGKEEKLFLVTEKGLNPVRKQEAKELLKIPFEQIMYGETFKRVLYLEGKSDLDILCAWANVLNHPVVRRLGKVMWIFTAEGGGRNFAQKNFRALRAQIPSLRGLEVRDRNGDESVQSHGSEAGHLKRIQKGGQKNPDALIQVSWTRYEIENYLMHPKTIFRFVSEFHDKERGQEAAKYMNKNWPPALIENPFNTSIHDQMKGKSVVAEVLRVAGLDISESDHYQLARAMKPDEIHPDVVAMLDAIEDQLTDDNTGR